jgi:hypothetical protein
MNLLQDILTYIRRIIKSPSNAAISDNLLIDYVNRFWIMDVDARIQLFDLKTKYAFQTVPGVDQYNMPLYNAQPEGGQNVALFPVYQGFLDPVYVNGVRVLLSTQKNSFFNIFPNIVQNLQVVATGTGMNNPYSFQIPLLPGSVPIPNNPPITAILRGHIDINGIVCTGNNVDPPFYTTLNTGIIPSTSILPSVYITSLDANGNNVIVTDSGQFLQVAGANMPNYGLLMAPGNAPFGYTSLGTYSTTSNTINYVSGQVNVNFPATIPAGQDINVQCYLFNPGLPRGVLFYNNTITLRTVPDTQYLVELDAYLAPAAFMTTSQAIPFGYMAEYIARGAARKILSDTGDVEQLQFYEPLFREQEMLVWKRSQRQFTATRTETIYSQGFTFGLGNNNFGGNSL